MHLIWELKNNGCDSSHFRKYHNIPILEEAQHGIYVYFE